MMLLRADPSDEVDLDALVPARPDVADLVPRQHRVPARPHQRRPTRSAARRATLDTVKQLTGLPINYLVTVNFSGFIADRRPGRRRLGGRRPPLLQRERRRGVRTSRTSTSSPGYQRLKGSDALVVRPLPAHGLRPYRLARQQQFVKALKEQITSNFQRRRRSRRSSARSRTTSRSAQAGGGNRSSSRPLRYALFAYGLPSGHFFQSKIDELTGTTSSATPTRRADRTSRRSQEFETPDIEAPRNATAVAFGRKAKREVAAAERISISVLNGNGVDGLGVERAYAARAAGLPDRHAAEPPPATRRTSSTSTRWSTTTSGSKRREAAAQKVADLFGDGAEAGCAGGRSAGSRTARCSPSSSARRSTGRSRRRP